MGAVFAKRSTFAQSFTIEELSRFTNKFNTGNGCWAWKAGKFNTGYGAFYSPVVSQLYNTAAVSSHRFMYELINGKIAKGLVIDHKCRNRSCVNPKHLQAITNGENVMLGMGVAPTNKIKTHCKNGHEYTPDNTYHRIRSGRNPERDCRICRMNAVTRYKKKVRVES